MGCRCRRKLELPSNNLMGTLPTALASLTSLQCVHTNLLFPVMLQRKQPAVSRVDGDVVCRTLDVSQNALKGTIPEQWSALSALRFVV